MCYVMDLEFFSAMMLIKTLITVKNKTNTAATAKNIIVHRFLYKSSLKFDSTTSTLNKNSEICLKYTPSIISSSYGKRSM